MIVGDIKLSYPCIKYNTDITHFTSRKSTAIEWVILELISKFSNSNDYGAVPVDMIFKEILQISDSDLLIKPCLINLVDLDAISALGLNDNVSLTEIPLSNIKLTTAGIKMQRQGLLPGDDNENKVIVYYDVITDGLIESNFKNLKEHSNGIPLLNIDDESNINFPIAMINKKLLKDQQSKSYQWLQSTTNIKEIKKSEGQLLWRNISKKVNISGNGLITIDGMEEDIKANDLLIQNRFSDVSDYDHLITSEETFENVDAGYSKIFFISELSEYMVEAIGENSIVLIDSRFWNDRYMKDIKFKDTTLMIHFNSNKFDFSYNNKRVIVQVPYSMPYLGCIVMNSKDNIFASKVTLHNDGGQAQFNLGYSKKNQVFKITEIVRKIINQFKFENYEVLCLYLLLDEEKSIFEMLPSVLQNLSTEDKIEAIGNLNQLCNGVSGRKINMDNEIRNILVEDVLAGQNYYSISNVEQALDKIMEYKICLSNEKILQQCILYILNSVQYIKKHPETLEIWKYLCGERKINTEWIGKNGPFNNLYSKDVLVSLFEKLLDEDYMDKSNEYTGAEKIYGQMKLVLKTLSRLLLSLNFKQLYSKQKMYEIIISESEHIDNIRNQALTWNDNKLRLKSEIIDYSELIEDSGLLKLIDNNMDLILDALSIFFDDDFIKYENVYILDTNVLIHKPDVFSLFSQRELVVVPTKVLQELDGLKNSKDEDISFHAREAMRQMDGNDRIKNENSYPELLPIDLRKEGADNLILSIALRYIVKRPMIISDDINLRNIAKSQKIKGTSLEGLIKMKEQEKKNKENNDTSKSNKNKKNKNKK